MNNPNLDKARKFLDYVAENEKRLKRNLAKNVTFDTDTFHDAFQDAILKVYDSILKNGTEIQNYETYFFMASRFAYILADKRNKSKQSKEVRSYDGVDLIDEEYNQDRDERITAAIEVLREALTDGFGKEDAALFLTYFGDKANGGTSYARIAQDHNQPTREVAAKIKAMRQYLTDLGLINSLKNFINDADD